VGEYGVKSLARHFSFFEIMRKVVDGYFFIFVKKI